MPPDVLTPALARLAALERRRPRRSLAPGRSRATPLDRLVHGLARDAAQAEALARSAAGVAEAVAEHFPENLFCDLDRLVAWMRRVLTDGGPDALSAYTKDIVAIHALFGRNGVIRFRYVHDFLYGFDWARYVRRDRTRRAGVDPYDPAFVRRMLARGGEIAEEIERDGPIYGRLRGPGYRNPFEFSREPDVEARVLAAMARDDNLPVVAYEPGGAARADRDFEALRRAYVERVEGR